DYRTPHACGGCSGGSSLELCSSVRRDGYLAKNLSSRAGTIDLRHCAATVRLAFTGCCPIVRPCPLPFSTLALCSRSVSHLDLDPQRGQPAQLLHSICFSRSLVSPTLGRSFVIPPVSLYIGSTQQRWSRCSLLRLGEAEALGD